VLRDALRRHVKWPVYADSGWPDYADSRQLPIVDRCAANPGAGEREIGENCSGGRFLELGEAGIHDFDAGDDRGYGASQVFKVGRPLDILGHEQSDFCLGHAHDEIASAQACPAVMGECRKNRAAERPRQSKCGHGFEAPACELVADHVAPVLLKQRIDVLALQVIALSRLKHLFDVAQHRCWESTRARCK
jgi:hypothetical protein